MKSVRPVVVVYEDAEARQAAVEFCDRLVEHFWAEHGFDVQWFAYENLGLHRQAAEATRQTANAHLIIFVTNPHRDPPVQIKDWVELWLSERGRKEGILVAITNPPPPSTVCPANQSYFRRIANRAGMDFAAELPQNIACDTESAESCTSRASQNTSVLDSIMRQPPARLW